MRLPCGIVLSLPSYPLRLPPPSELFTSTSDDEKLL